MKKIALTLIGCFGMLCSYAQQTPEELFNLGLEAEKAKNYEEAVRYYRQSAEMGDVQAQCNLAVCYCNGLGVEQDYEQAVYWYRLSAGQGDYIAQNNLGWLYERGLGGLNKDLRMAKYWYAKSAEQGFTIAQFNLAGRYYEDGDYEAAINWYDKIAGSAESENDLLSAQSMLGTSYFKSNDYDKAFEYWTKAAENGRQYAAIGVGVCYRDGKGVPADAAKALSIFEKVYEESNASYEKEHSEEGSGDEETWRKFYDLAARAAEQICYCYYKGIGVKKDWEKAAEYFLFYKYAESYGLGWDDVFLSESVYEDMERDLTKTKYYIDNYVGDAVEVDFTLGGGGAKVYPIVFAPENIQWQTNVGLISLMRNVGNQWLNMGGSSVYLDLSGNLHIGDGGIVYLGTYGRIEDIETDGNVRGWVREMSMRKGCGYLHFKNYPDGAKYCRIFVDDYIYNKDNEIIGVELSYQFQR